MLCLAKVKCLDKTSNINDSGLHIDVYIVTSSSTAVLNSRDRQAFLHVCKLHLNLNFYCSSYYWGFHADAYTLQLQT